MTINFVSKALLVLGLTSLLAACETVAPASQTTVTRVVAAPAAVDLRLTAGDKLRVIVFGEESLTGEYTIDIGGNVSMPLAGTVKAAGLSKAELERVLASRLSGEYLKDPKVTVEVATFRPFYILGEVEKPGEYPYKSGLNVVSAMAVAGGPTYRASNSTIEIQRGGVGPFQEVALSPMVAIYPGDLIRVPERFF